MELKFKRLDTEKAIMPIRAYKGDAGLDLTATDITLEPNECGQTVVVYHTGLAVEIPEGYVGLLFPRSSIARVQLRCTYWNFQFGMCEGNVALCVGIKSGAFSSEPHDFKHAQESFRAAFQLNVPVNVNIGYGVVARF